MFNVLIVDDDYVLRSSLEETLESHKSVSSITHAENGKRGLDRILNEDYNLVFLDIDLPMLDGMSVLREAVAKKTDVIYILMTAYGRISDTVEALKLGAFNYLEKPLKDESINKILDEIRNANDLMQSVKNLSPVAFEEGKEIVGGTEKVSEVLNLIKRLSKVTTPVLIQGESGTGKELVARALHFNSPRKSKPFVTTNCSAVPEALFESEFFGHEKGSFTGADEKKIGKFQFAQGGTLFLDEVGDLSLMNQVKLLRVLQEKKYTPVGSNLEIPYDVRIVAATHKDLEKMVEKNEFRQDLFFRLNVMSLEIPSLKERKSDISDLIKIFIEKFNLKHDRNVLGCKPDYLAKLMNYDFPGNVRELENAIERGFVLTDGQWLESKSLPSQILGNETEKVKSPAFEDTDVEKKTNAGGLTPEISIDSSDLDYQKNKEDFEKQFIEEALKRNKGMLNQTALQANIPKKTLQRKILKYKIDTAKFKPKKKD